VGQYAKPGLVSETAKNIMTMYTQYFVSYIYIYYIIQMLKWNAAYENCYLMFRLSRVLGIRLVDVRLSCCFIAFRFNFLYFNFCFQ
jgi:hypothetical protein